jgi:hypothetical protein
MERKTVEAECGACGGTGLYRGFCEKRGEAVVCLGCSGSGKVSISYTPFIERKQRSDVQTIRLSRGTTLLGCGGVGDVMTYDDFLKRFS